MAHRGRLMVGALYAGALALLVGGGCGAREPEKAPDPLPPDRVVAPGSVEDSVTLADVRTSDNQIQGTVINNSDRQVADVHLLVNHSFLWKNERNPGKDNPSRTEYFRVAKPIPPRGSMSFEYRPDPPLPKRADGTFITTVEIVSFAEIGQ